VCRHVKEEGRTSVLKSEKETASGGRTEKKKKEKKVAYLR